MSKAARFNPRLKKMVASKPIRERKKNAAAGDTKVMAKPFQTQQMDAIDDLNDPNEVTVHMERNAARFALFYTQKRK